MKKLTVVITVAFFLMLLSVTASAEGAIEDEYSKYEVSGEITDALPDGTYEILEQLGITDGSLGEIYSVTPKRVFDTLFNIFTGSLKKPFLYCILSTVILGFSSFGSETLKNGKILSVAGSCVSSLFLAVPLAETIGSVFSLTEGLCNFGAVFSGVFCAAVSSSGGNLSAVSYEGAMLFFNSLVSAGAQGVSMPLINGMCATAFFSCVNTFSLTEQLSGLIKKIYITVLGFFGTVFTAFISLKSVLSYSADTLTSKSVKFIIGRTLPVVGGAVSESYSSVMAGLLLVKNTVGAFGIISIAVIVLPTLLTLFSWACALRLSEGAAQMFSSPGQKTVLPVFKDVITLLTATVVFVSAVFIVSAGVLLLVTGGAFF